MKTPPAFLAGGGISGALMRSVDWSATAVGPVSGWPESLKTTIGILLHSRHPMFLWWGPDLVQFYNDAYLPSFGEGKHPTAMGQRGADCWQETWPIISPQIDDVMQRAKPSWNEDALVPIFRNGRLEEVYWTYGFSPVFEEGGAVGGTLVVCTETTARVLSERRLRTLRRFVERTVLAASHAAVMEGAAEILASEPADVPFALLYDGDADASSPVLVRSSGISEADAAAVDALVRERLGPLSRQPAAEPLAEPVVTASNPWPEAITAVFVARIVSRSDQKPSGYAVLGVSPRLPFDRAYHDYMRQLAEHIAQAQSRIEALQLRSVIEHERNNLLEQAPVATALLTGPEHTFRIANPPYLKLVGRRGIVGRTFAEVFPEQSEAPLAAIADHVYASGEPFVGSEMPLRQPLAAGDAAERFFNFNIEPLRNAAGDVYGIMAVVVDVTPQVLARRVLEQSNVERDALLRELEDASRAKDEFLAMLGHELRNPLAPILTALQLMRLRGVQGADKERTVIERQVQHVVRLVDDLLDVSRITRGKIELKVEALRLADVLAKSIEMASPAIEQRLHRLTIDVPDDLFVDGDSARLAQVFANVLTNAAKYTEPPGRIEVWAERHGAEAWVSIRDNGVGIEPSRLEHMFDPFAQERQDSDRSQGGLGLGLAIVRSFVNAHGGRVTLESDGRGRGTECLICLPLATEGVRQAIAPAAASAPNVSGTTVLVVDDNKDAADTLADLLRALGHDVRVAYDAVQALEVAARGPASIALLDLGLPVVDGYELAARLRSLPGWQKTRMVALTGYGLANDRRKTKRAGFDAHFVKPIDIAAVDEAIRSLGTQPS